MSVGPVAPVDGDRVPADVERECNRISDARLAEPSAVNGIKVRYITSHQVNGLNEHLRIVPLDEPGPGGANHLYEIGWGGMVEIGENNPTVIKFQHGPIGEVGINGISNEALLAIVEDRLKGFQSGPFACADNAFALGSVQLAMDALNHRTRERVERGVEGTTQV